MSKNIKILFLYPNKGSAVMGGDQPLGVASLAAVLKRNGYDFDFFDTTFILRYDSGSRRFEGHKLTSIEKHEKRSLNECFELLINKFNLNEYDVLLVSTVTSTFGAGTEFTKKIKEINPKIFTIFGGIHPTVAAEKVITNPYIDAVCIGEGEEALIELLDLISNNKDFRRVRNFWFKKDNKIIKNPPRPYINLDSTPYPDYSIFEEKHFYRPFDGKAYRMVAVETSRGCPYKCSYCANKRLQDLYAGICAHHRRESIEKSISKLEFVKEKYQPEFLRFVDESFTIMNISHLEKFARLYKEKINLPFWIQTSAAALNENKVKLLSEMNCAAVVIGVEHGNEQFRKKVLNKNVSDKQIFNAMSLLKKYNIRRTAYFMVGLPFETRELIFETIKMYKKLILEYGAAPSSLFCFYPFPGTELLDICLKNNFISKDNMNIESSGNQPALDMPNLSKEEATGIARAFFAYSVMDEKLYPIIRICEEKNKYTDRILREISNIYSDYVAGKKNLQQKKSQRIHIIEKKKSSSFTGDIVHGGRTKQEH